MFCSCPFARFAWFVTRQRVDILVLLEIEIEVFLQAVSLFSVKNVVYRQCSCFRLECGLQTVFMFLVRMWFTDSVQTAVSLHALHYSIRSLAGLRQSRAKRGFESLSKSFED